MDDLQDCFDSYQCEVVIYFNIIVSFVKKLIQSYQDVQEYFFDGVQCLVLDEQICQCLLVVLYVDEVYLVECCECLILLVFGEVLKDYVLKSLDSFGIFDVIYGLKGKY